MLFDYAFYVRKLRLPIRKAAIQLYRQFAEGEPPHFKFCY